MMEAKLPLVNLQGQKLEFASLLDSYQFIFRVFASSIFAFASSYLPLLLNSSAFAFKSATFDVILVHVYPFWISSSYWHKNRPIVLTGLVHFVFLIVHYYSSLE